MDCDEKTYASAKMYYDEKIYVRQIEKAGEFLIKHAHEIAKDHGNDGSISIDICVNKDKVLLQIKHEYELN